MKLKLIYISTYFLIATSVSLEAQTKIGSDINGQNAFDFSAKSLALSADGTTVIIGAPFSNAHTNTDIGNARVFKDINGIWTQIGLDIEGIDSDYQYGHSVAISSDGSIVAVAANRNDATETSTFNSGRVRVFKNVSGTWTQIGLDINGEAFADASGQSISLSSDGNIIAIGSPNNDESFPDAGQVRIFQNISGTWTKIGSSINGEATNDLSGSCISLSADGKKVAIATPFNDGNGSNSGHVRVYENISGTWTKIGSDIDGEHAGDQSGTWISLSADGSRVAIGAPYNSDNGSGSGQVRVYQNNSGTWTKIGSDIDGQDQADSLGQSVSLSADGTIVAISAPNHNPNIDKNHVGIVRILKDINGVWTQVGLNIEGEHIDDTLGVGGAVSLSADGTRVAVGTPFNSDNGSNSGQTQVYDLSTILSSDSFVLASFCIYPNPASERIYITLQNYLTLEKVNIYNTIGQLIKTEKKSDINISNLSKGNYFFEVYTNKGKATKTIIIE